MLEVWRKSDLIIAKSLAGLSDQLELQKLMVSDLRELIDSKNEIIRLLKNENLSLKNKLAAGNTLGD